MTRVANPFFASRKPLTRRGILSRLPVVQSSVQSLIYNPSELRHSAFITSSMKEGFHEQFDSER